MPLPRTITSQIGNEGNVEQFIACTNLRRKLFSYIIASSSSMMREESIINQQQPLNMPVATSSNSPESSGGENAGENVGDNAEENRKLQSHIEYHSDLRFSFNW